MLGISSVNGSSISSSNNRVFIYEVSGLKQSEQNDNNNYPFRTSGTVEIQVTYNRMNAEMQRITRMGGTITSIRPLGTAPASKSSDNSESEGE